MVTMLTTFLSGVAVGFAIAVYLLLYILSFNSPKQSEEHTAIQNTKSVYEEEPPTEESRKLLKEAIKYLACIQEGRDISPPKVLDDEGVASNCTLYQLEQIFDSFCTGSKDRLKNLKCLSTFTSEVGRAYAVFAKDLSKISASARSNVKSIDQQQIMRKGSSLDDVNTAERITDCTNEWWKTLSSCLSHLSNDTEELSELMIADCSMQITHICDAFVSDEKKLIAEGSKLLNQLKDGLLKNEHLSQDRDKLRIKASSAGQADDYNRKGTRLQQSELALSENMKIVQHYKNDFKAQMPMIFSNFRSASTKFLASMKIQLMKVADLIRRQNTCSNSITQRLKSQISATGILVKAGEIPKTLMGFEPMLQNVLSAEAEAGAVTEESSDVPRITSPPPSASLNMASESTACLAASAPAVLPPLPSSFGRCVKEETCVWFNAFSGRIYRDAARSEYFHAWLLSKLTTQLNKGAKPGFIDEVVVESVTFGSTPPLLMNVKWSPAASQAKSKDRNGLRKSATGSNNNNSSSNNNNNNNNSSSGTSFNESDRGENSNEDVSDKEINTASVPSSDSSPTNTEASADAADSDYSTFNVTVSAEDISDALHGPQGGARKGHISVSPSIQSDNQKSSTRDSTPEYPSSTSTSSTEHPHTSTSSSSSPSDFSDEDIECTADMAYRSGLKFKISTRLWCNWPRDRYASIPVTLILELVEISGRVRFGVTHSASYFTFLEEPHTRFAVHSEVGGDTFKLKDIPTLSDYIVKKLKDFILKKFVDPSCHSFRLIWPRSWWPLDVQQKHSGTGSAPQDPLTDSTSTSTTSTSTATTTASATTSKISVTLDMKSDMKNEVKNEVKNEKKSALRGEVRGGNGLQDGSIIVSGILGPSSNSRTLQACTSSQSPEGLQSSSSSISTITTTTTTSTTTSSTSCATPVVGSDHGTVRSIPSIPVAQPLPLPLPLSTTAAAAIASFSSTTAGWLREEVRRRGQPVSAQSTPTNSPPSLPLPVPATSPSPSSLSKLDSVNDVLKVEKDSTSVSDVIVSNVKKADENNSVNGPTNYSTTNNKHENVRQVDNHHDELKHHGKHDKSVVHSSEISKEGNISGTGEHNLWPAFLQNSSIPHFLHRKSHSLSHSQSHTQSQSNSHSQPISSPEANSPESGRMKAFAKMNDLKSQSLETLADTLLGPRCDVIQMKNNGTVLENNNNNASNNDNSYDNSNSNSSINNDVNYDKSSHSSHDVGNVSLSTSYVSAQDHETVPKGTETEYSSDPLQALNSPVQNSSSSSSSSGGQDVNKCNGSSGISPTDEGTALHKLSIDVEEGESKGLNIAPVPISMPMSVPLLDAQPALSPVHSDQLSSTPIIDMNTTATASSCHSDSKAGEPVYDAKEAIRIATPSNDAVTISSPQHHNHSSASSDAKNILPVLSTSPLTLSHEISAAANNKVQHQHQQQQQLKAGEREEKINPGKEKYVEKSEWFNKLGEAKEKFQNKFSVFKSKLVHLPGAALSPSSHLNSPNTSTSLSDILLPKLTDATVVSAKPIRIISTAEPQQPPVTYKSALPELLISAISSLTSPSPSPSHHSNAVGTWVGTGTGTATSTVQTKGILVDSGSAGVGVVGGGAGVENGGGVVGGVDSTRQKNLRSFSPITRYIHDPILRARSTSDASSHRMRPESDPLGSSRNRRALSVGTFESAFSAPKAAELSHSAKNKNLNLKGSFKSTLKATTTPQERRYNMYKHFEMSLADRENDEEGLDELIIPTPFNAVGKFGMLSSDAKLISLCGSEMSPNAAVMMYEQQLTSTERSESSFSPGDHRAPALSRMGVLWAPPNTERMWAELSIGGRYGKASLQLYFVGDKCPQGIDADDSRKTVSFLDHTDRASVGVFDNSTSNGDDNSNSNSNSSSSTGSCTGLGIGAGTGTGTAAGTQGSKMVLAASYDLQEAECRQLPRSITDEALIEQPQLSLNSITEGTQASVPHTAGFEILLHTDRKKWIPFMCPTEEDCDDWMDAIDNVAHV